MECLNSCVVYCVLVHAANFIYNTYSLAVHDADSDTAGILQLFNCTKGNCM